MTTSLFTLMLALPVIGTPAPKEQGGLSPAIIDLLPADTAAVLLIDVPRVAKSPIGRRFAKYLLDGAVGNSIVAVSDVIADVELAVVGQFDIVQFAGDFCVILRLRKGAALPERLLAAAADQENNSSKQTIGRHTIYRLDTLYFSVIDSRTVVFVSFTNDPSGVELENGLNNVFASRRQPGPRAELRHRLNDIPFDHAVAIVSDHPKSGTSLKLALFPLGFEFNQGAATEYQDKVVSYRVGVAVGNAAEAIVEIAAKNAEAAKEIVATLETLIEQTSGKDWADALRHSTKVACTKEKVTLRMTADRTVIDRIFDRE